MSKIEVRLNPDTPPTGTDLSVVNAARRSFNKRSDWDWVTPAKGKPVGASYNPALKDKDKRLIEFLARGMAANDFESFVKQVPAPDTEQHAKELKEMLWHWRNTPVHDTPFNHTFISFEVKAPIFCRAQLVKHEYLIMSEFSRRYITDDIEFYEPDYWRKAAPNKKQGSLEEEVLSIQTNHSVSGKVVDYSMVFSDYTEIAQNVFEGLLEQGVAPEQARMVLPQSTMTEWTWSGTLGAFAKMCQLRLHPEAQYEARLVAQEVYKHLKAQWPVSAKALVEGPDV